MFTVAAMVSCTLHIFLTLFITIDTLIITSAALCLVSALTLMLCVHIHWVVVWVCCMGLGAGSQITIPLIQIWGDRVVTADGKYQTYFFTGQYIGLITFPSLMGLLIETVGIVCFLYVVTAFAAGLSVSVVFLKIFKGKLEKSRQRTIVPFCGEEQTNMHVYVNEASVITHM